MRTPARPSTPCARCPAARRVLDALARARRACWSSAAPCATLLLGRTPRELDLVVEGDAVAARARRLGERRRPCTSASAPRRSRRRRRPVDLVARPRASATRAPGRAARRARRRDARRGPAPPRLHASTRSPSASTARCAASSARCEDLDAGGCASCTTRRSPTTRRGCGALARYAARLGLRPRAAHRRLARAAVATGALATVTGDRLGAELRLALRRARPARGAARAALELGLLPPGSPCATAAPRAALELRPPTAAPTCWCWRACAPASPPTRCAAGWPTSGFTARASATLVAAALARRRRPRRSRAARTTAEIAAAARGAPVEAVALAGGRGGARRWLRRPAPRARWRSRPTTCWPPGVPQGPELGRAPAPRRSTAQLDGARRGREAELRRGAGDYPRTRARR